MCFSNVLLSYCDKIKKKYMFNMIFPYLLLSKDFSKDFNTDMMNVSGKKG